MAFRLGVLDAHAPDNAVECALAERVADLLWRLRRASQAERDVAIEQGQRERIMAEAKRKRAAHFADWRERNERPEHSDTISSRAEADAAAIPPSIRVLPDPLTLQIVSKYEARLNRQLLHTLHELEAMQERRAGRAAPLARIDVQTSDH